MDQGHQPVAIAAALKIRAWTVYGVLRKERPDRTRSPRRRTSDVPATVRGLVAAGVGVPRVAALLKISVAYVYQILEAERSARQRAALGNSVDIS